MTTSPDIILRDYRPEDAVAITRIYAHYVRTSVATFDLEPPTIEYISQKFASMVTKGHPVIIAMSKDTIIGYAYASEYRDRSGYRFTCEDTVYLDPQFTGKGIGKILLYELIQKAKTFGFKQMIGIIAGGIEPSIKLHQSTGFKILGRFPKLGYKFNDWVDIVHVQLEL